MKGAFVGAGEVGRLRGRSLTSLRLSSNLRIAAKAPEAGPILGALSESALDIPAWWRNSRG